MQSDNGNATLKHPALSIYTIGIASLVLEGRIISTDEDDEGFKVSSGQSVGDIIDVGTGSSSGEASVSRNSVMQRISEKLWSLRQIPGVNNEIIETSTAIPLQSHDDTYEHFRMRSLNTNSFQHNLTRSTMPTAPTSSSSAASVLHDIDVDWNDTSILYNGLEKIQMPTSPIKLQSQHSFRNTSNPMARHHEQVLKMYKNKEKCANGSSMSYIQSKPRQGPHCEQFLKNICVIKVETSEDNDHVCNHISSYCRRWQFYLRKLAQLLARGEDTCIEVYLGPENNAILLEQWIFCIVDKPSTTTMTIQALCNAIRSQLYFSQTSSWVDLLKKSSVNGDINIVNEQLPRPFSPEVMQNPRLKKNFKSKQVNLDILFRIKPVDGSSCFNDKPNVHIFPDTIVAENLAIRVCLKSLPRLDKIPTLNTEKANLNGFLCDNSIYISLDGPSTVTVPSSPPSAVSSNHLINDRLSYISCHVKGKHRCRNDEDEEDVELLSSLDSTDTAGASCSNIQNTNNTAPTTSLSHRERQLLKYKKRLMKREKAKKKQDGDQTSVSSLNSTISEEFTSCDIPISINDTQAPLYDVNKPDSAAGVMVEITKNTTANNHNNNSYTNHSLKTLSIATQTDYDVNDQLMNHNHHYHYQHRRSSCDNCGNKLQCWNCDNKIININTKQESLSSLSSLISVTSMSTAPSATITSSAGAIGTMIGNQGDLLLQAIQRTADAHTNDDNIGYDPNEEDNTSLSVMDIRNKCDNNNYNNNNKEVDQELIKESKQDRDCHLCKRQKTKHNYTSVTSVNGGSYRRTMSECLVGVNDDDDNSTTMNYSPSNPSTNYDDTEFNYTASTSQLDQEAFKSELKNYRRAFSEDVINVLAGEESTSNDDDDCLTILCHCDKIQQKKTKTAHGMSLSAKLKLTPNVNLQQQYHFESSSSCSRDYMSISPHKKHTSLGNHKQIPKNLSNVFNQQFQNDSGIVLDISSPASDGVFSYNSSPAANYPPRFLSVNSMLKRFRHISDPSSMSECSIVDLTDDEDDLKGMLPVEESGKMLLPPAKLKPPTKSKISSLYKKFVHKTHAAFSKLPLLGTLEESLLRDRFTPKSIVNGFKVLLGASGSFCPTQLTIPAQTFFYEFHGLKHMATPYVCEFRLSRRGYSIPRSGTVQATLLNPLGTVVRMFVVPYDFRDMPLMSKTFIRQRVLALDDGISLKEADQLSTAEQMKYLRYVIHLRFQTGRSGRLCLHTDVKLLISRRTDQDTAAAHAKNSLESLNDLKLITIIADQPKYSTRIDKPLI
ncbi:unnamed protein product [Diamesa serratosioi]